METGLLQNQTAISLSETWASKRFLLRATRTFEKMSSLQFYLWICSQLRLWRWDVCLFSAEGVVQGNLFCYCLKALMTVQVFNVTLFRLVWLGWVFFPINSCKSCRGECFSFCRLALPLQHGKSKVVWFHCFCLEFKEENCRGSLQLNCVPVSMLEEGSLSDLFSPGGNKILAYLSWQPCFPTQSVPGKIRVFQQQHV